MARSHSVCPIEPSSQPIISVSGLRGLIGSQLTPLVVTRYVSAFCSQLEGNRIVIARDGRESGPMLAQAVASTLMANGCHVLDADVAATPTVGVLVRHLNADGAIQISASHNPIEYNGLKLFNAEGRVLPAIQGRGILEAYQRGDAAWCPVASIGRYERVADPHQPHLDSVLAHHDGKTIRNQRFRVYLDSNRGAGSLLGKRLLDALGCDYEVGGSTPDGQFEHPPEPIEENLASIGPRIRDGKFQVGFCQDPDADRLALIDEHGTYIGEEYTVALCALNFLEQRPGPFVVNCATSHMNRFVAERFGVPFFQSAVGEANVVDGIRQQKAVFGGEGNGGPIDPRVGWVRDSFVGMAAILELMARKGKSISQLVAELPKLAMIKSKMELSSQQLQQSLEKLRLAMQADDVSTQDGIRLSWKDRWILLRGSNTEPIVRLIAEAPTQRDAQDLIDRARRSIAM